MNIRWQWAGAALLSLLLVAQGLVLFRLTGRIEGLERRLAAAPAVTTAVARAQPGGEGGEVRVAITPGDGPSLGKSHAPVTVVEFADFQCPFCARAQESIRQLREKYPDQVRVVHRDFPISSIHPMAAHAAMAARCAGDQGAYWPYHDVLYSKALGGETLNGTDQLVTYARQLALKLPAFEQCLKSDRYREAVQKDWEAGMAYGVGATPTFFINGYMLTGAQPVEEFERLVEKALQEVASAGR